MLILESRYNPLFVLVSIVVAIVASYVALDLVASVSKAKGRAQILWLMGGALAMGLGIWSMHFIGMLAFNIQGVEMAYDIPLMTLSIGIAFGASGLALFVVSRPRVPIASLVASGIAMAAAIAGMHYTGMYSMRMDAKIQWNIYLVCVSVVIALIASFGALLIAIRLRNDRRSLHKWAASCIMGFAISGMHYTGMSAATFIYAKQPITGHHLLASSGLGLTVFLATAIILAVALLCAFIDRAFDVGRKKVDTLNEESELRERFVSALAHDLRTPLAAAKMSAQLCLRNLDDVEKFRKHGYKITDNLNRMDQMIQDLLDAHRISAGQPLPLQLEPCSFPDLVKIVFEDLSTLHGDRFHLECPIPLVGKWDPRYLRRAVENLCNNAIKYGESDTSVRVKAEEIMNDQVVISVQNRGPALSLEERTSLFTLFHRSHTAELAGKRGWGLGLTIVKGIAEAHHGKVAVESAQGTTTFSITLPKNPASARSVEPKGLTRSLQSVIGSRRLESH